MMPLGIAVALVDALHEEQIRYCHWKSNAHVREGMCGITDLDLLIDRRQHERAQRVLARCGFKRFAPAAGQGYPAVEDHLGLDGDTGALLHCHVHYRLVAGERHLKGYRLPWEDVVLDRRVWDEAAGIFVAAPEVEMLTLLVRGALKLRLRDIARHLARRGAADAGIAAEYAWLRERIDRAECLALGRTLLGAAAEPRLAALLDRPPGLAALRRLARALRREHALLRSHGPVAGRVLRWTREGVWLAAGINRRLLRSAHPLRRTVPAGGITVAFLGCDGSGKSTIARDVASLLAGKTDVLLVYFGSGDGPGSLVRWPLRVAHRAAKAAGLLRRTNGAPEPAAAAGRAGAPGARRGRIMSIGLVLWALALSLEKRRKLQASWRARNLGMIVITDRYPQAQLAGFNDGPLLRDCATHRSRILRALARWEAVPYAWAERHAPDLVIRLQVAPETALRRKPETGRAEVERRVDAIRRIGFGPGTAVVDIDAGRPLDEVRRDVRRLVWCHI